MTLAAALVPRERKTFSAGHESQRKLDALLEGRLATQRRSALA